MLYSHLFDKEIWDGFIEIEKYMVSNMFEALLYSYWEQAEANFLFQNDIPIIK